MQFLTAWVALVSPESLAQATFFPIPEELIAVGRVPARFRF